MFKKWTSLAVIVCILVLSVIILNFVPAEPIGLGFFSTPDFVTSQPGAETPDDAADIASLLQIQFSHEDHFYDSNIEVALTPSIPGATIYYTIDSSEPTVDSFVYTGPIHIYAVSKLLNTGIHVIKAIAEYEGVVTAPFVHTYFVAKDIHERFDAIVVSISTNREYLYDYDTGIMVAGRTRDEYIKNNPGVHIDPPAPANFNWRGMEGERPVYVEIFEPDGTRVIAQPAGVRVHGGWSRAETYKSLRLIARREYSPDTGKFRYDFFPDDVRADGFDTPITRYDQILLSNNANDRSFGMLRQEVNYALAKMAGIREVSPVRAAAVFLNGVYYGFAWLETIINDQYLEEVYNAPVRDFQIIGNSETKIENTDEEELEAIAKFNVFYYKDFTDDNVMKEFEEIVDVDNLMLYYAYQTLVGNRDWPNNNMKRWRYSGPQPGEELPPVVSDPVNTNGVSDMPPELVQGPLAPELDGRWRFIMYDMDFLMSLYEDTVRPGSPSFTSFVTRGNDRYSYILSALFARQDMIDKYAMYVCDLAANVLTADNVSQMIDRFYSEAYHELGYAFSTGKYAHWVNNGSVEFNHRNMIEYTARRGETFMGQMRDYFKWDDKMFSVEVSGSKAVIGSGAGGASSSTYFAHLTIPLRPNLDRFEVFDYWVLDGKIIDTPEIFVTSADAKNGVVKLELVTHMEIPPLQITQAYAYSTSRDNGAVLSNVSSDSIRTEGLFFTDDLQNPQRWALPVSILNPGDIMEFSGRASRDSGDIHKLQMNFNVSLGEVLYLCNEDGEVLHWLVVSEIFDYYDGN